jgi:putative addiction module component (TIGR02574 family)
MRTKAAKGTRRVTKLQIATTAAARLSKREKLALIDRVWSDLSRDQDQIPVPQWQIRELEKSLAEYEAEPVKQGSHSIDEVIARITAKNGR